MYRGHTDEKRVLVIPAPLFFAGSNFACRDIYRLSSQRGQNHCLPLGGFVTFRIITVIIASLHY